MPDTKALALPSDDGSSEGTVVPNTPPQAVLPQNHHSKLDQEPNPFEESFSGQAAKKRTVLPPVASITSPVSAALGTGTLSDKAMLDPMAWDSLRSGPLSPTMLAGPAKPDGHTTLTAVSQSQPHDASALAHAPSGTHAVPMQPAVGTADDSNPARKLRSQRKISSYASSPCDTSEEENGSKQSNKRSHSGADSSTSRKKARSRERYSDDDEKRKSFLERNRIAALKCRQRKKQWLNDLQSRVEILTCENEQLQLQKDAMREEIVNLKTLLMAHKDCPIAESNGFTAAALQKSTPAAIPPHLLGSASEIALPESQPALYGNASTSVSHAMAQQAMIQNTVVQSRPLVTSIPFEGSTAVPASMMTANPFQPVQPMMHLGVVTQAPASVAQQRVLAGAGGMAGVMRF